MRFLPTHLPTNPRRNKMKATTKFSPVTITMETARELEMFEKMIYMFSEGRTLCPGELKDFTNNLSDELCELYNYEDDDDNTNI